MRTRDGRTATLQLEPALLWLELSPPLLLGTTLLQLSPPLLQLPPPLLQLPTPLLQQNLLSRTPLSNILLFNRISGSCSARGVYSHYKKRFCQSSCREKNTKQTSYKNPMSNFPRVFLSCFWAFLGKGFQHTTKKSQEIFGTATFLASDPPTHHGGLRLFVLGGPLPLVAHDAHFGPRSYRDIDSYLHIYNLGSRSRQARAAAGSGEGKGETHKKTRGRQAPQDGSKPRERGAGRHPRPFPRRQLECPGGGDAQPALRAQGSMSAPRMCTARICVAALACCCTLASHRNNSVSCWVCASRLKAIGHRQVVVQSSSSQTVHGELLHLPQSSADAAVYVYMP
jgi:hypothetical protein